MLNLDSVLDGLHGICHPCHHLCPWIQEFLFCSQCITIAALIDGRPLLDLWPLPLIIGLTYGFWQYLPGFPTVWHIKAYIIFQLQLHKKAFVHYYSYFLLSSFSALDWLTCSGLSVVGVPFRVVYFPWEWNILQSWQSLYPDHLPDLALSNLNVSNMLSLSPMSST